MSSSAIHSVLVHGLPTWLDVTRLLGPALWTCTPRADGTLSATASMDPERAADVGARLRGVGLGGVPLRVEIDPPLSRSHVRAARAQEARRMRNTTPGFKRREARASGEGRFSLTPEALAVRLGQRARGRRVVDACAGAGGNTLGFARAGCQVTAIEASPERLDELRHNLALYGMSGRVRVIPGDLRVHLAEARGDLLFADPPWGERYDRLVCRRDAIPLIEPLLVARSRFRELWLKLPPSFDVRQLPRPKVEAVFGEAPGDGRRVKFLLVGL